MGRRLAADLRAGARAQPRLTAFVLQETLAPDRRRRPRLARGGALRDPAFMGD